MGEQTDKANWQRLNEIFAAALQLDTGARAAFLDENCSPDLRPEVEALLAANRSVASQKFLEANAFNAATRVLAEPQAEDALEGKRIGSYRIVNEIGRGGMGAVYLAERADAQFRQRVALKIIKRGMDWDEIVRRFRRERQVLAALNHSHIARLLDGGTTDEGLPFFVMEYVAGTPINEFCDERKLNIEERLQLFRKVCDAVSYIHQNSIIHRDIKPSNILVTKDGAPKLLDFGIAKILMPEGFFTTVDQTATGVQLFTPQYASPEQVRGERVTTSSDIYSLGVMLYELLCGHQPLRLKNRSPLEVLKIVSEHEPTAPSTAALTTEEVDQDEKTEELLSPETVAGSRRESPDKLKRRLRGDLDNITLKALRKEPDQRYESVAELSEDIRRHLERVPVKARKASVTYRSAKFVGRNRTAVAVAALIVVLVVSIGGSWSYFYWHSKTAVLSDKDTILLADFTNTTGDTVFDSTLKEALAIQLEQSPFLSIYSDQRVREALRFMERSPDERITPELAREICQRQGLKAYLAGSIAPLGGHLVVRVDAVNAQTGDTLAREQLEVETKEQVLDALGKSATRLRAKLGESLGSIQRYDVPTQQATTSSLEALRAYSMATEQASAGKLREAIPLYKRALELDPKFARAYEGLAHSYSNLGQRQLAREAGQNAFDLRERNNEHEKLRISSSYYELVTGDLERAVEVLQQLTRTYPRDSGAHNNLAVDYSLIGRYEEAIEEARAALRLNPDSVPAYVNLATAFQSLGRFDEAKQTYEQALSKGLETTSFHLGLYTLAFLRADQAAMQQQIDWISGKPNQYLGFFWQAGTASYFGRLRQAHNLSQRGAEDALTREFKERAADNLSISSSRDAVTGNCQRSVAEVPRISPLPPTVTSFFGVGVTLALCGDPGAARAIEEDYSKQFPKDTLVNAVWLPSIRAAAEIRRNNPRQAIQFLEVAKRYERKGEYWPQYLRGQAYLAQKSGPEAAHEFQEILAHRALAPASVLYPLAYIGLAQAATLQSDRGTAQKAYEGFLALWKDADTNTPILIDAKKAYSRLR